MAAHPPLEPYAPTIEVSRDAPLLMRAAALRIATLAERAISRNGRFNWVLSGGSTPRQLYALLARERFAPPIDWSRVEFFWGDERCVPPDHADSNYRRAREALLDAIAVDPKRVHRMRGEDAPARAASAYETLIRAHFDVAVNAAPPSFDLVMLGMGADGHTASIFPETPALEEAERWVVANRPASSAGTRLTLTLPIINAAAAIVFLISGDDKAERVHEVLARHASAHALPASRVRPSHGHLYFMLDAAAASRLETPR